VRAARHEGRGSRIALRAFACLVVAFLYLPILLIFVYAFNSSNVQGWPITSFSTRWFGPVWDDSQVRSALVLTLKCGVAATVIALLLGTLAAFAVHRFHFFGREVISFALVLPIALPGIVTGMALSSYFTFLGVTLSIWTIVIAHATFCVVVVYNNAIARLRRLQPSLEEASMDLGAHGLQTFRYVTLPSLSTALVAGGLLAFALSFDEVIVTTLVAGAQNTLPLWIFGNIRNAQRLPEVNVVAMAMVLATVIPVWLAQRLMGASGGVVGR
jgi:putative spermidine/putrescine transport system permease protein